MRLSVASAARRSPAAPDLPTVAEVTGIADFDFTLWAGFFGPRATPADIVTTLHAAINKIIGEPDIRSRLQDSGVEVTAMSTAEFADFVRGEIGRYQAIIKEANIKSE